MSVTCPTAAALRVSVPVPDKVPPVCVRFGAATGAFAINVPPDRLIAFTASGPPIVSDPLLTPSVLFTCDALLPSVRMPPPICSRSWLDTAAAACDPAADLPVPWGEQSPRVLFPRPHVQTPELKRVVPQKLSAEEHRRCGAAAARGIRNDVLHGYEV